MNDLLSYSVVGHSECDDKPSYFVNLLCEKNVLKHVHMYMFKIIHIDVLFFFLYTRRVPTIYYS